MFYDLSKKKYVFARTSKPRLSFIIDNNSKLKYKIIKFYLLGNDSVIGGIPTTIQVSLAESRTAEAINGKRTFLFLFDDAT